MMIIENCGVGKLFASGTAAFNRISEAILQCVGGTHAVILHPTRHQLLILCDIGSACSRGSTS